MTIINLHGILAKEFGSCISMEIHKPKEVIDAITVNKPLFKQRAIDLAKEGVHYAIIVDGENITKMEQLEMKKTPQKIDLVPVVCGQGVVFAISAWLSQHAFVASLLASLLMTVATTALQMILAPKPKAQKIEATVSAAKQSFIFSSKANVAEQGIPVPVGYGRLRVGSFIIQSTIKSYPQKLSTVDTLIGNALPTVVAYAPRPTN